MHDIPGNPHDGTTERHHHERAYTSSALDLRERRKISQSTNCVLYHLHGLQTTGEVYCFGVYRTAYEAGHHSDEIMLAEPATKFEIVEIRQ
jgi:hypothetical protein